MSARAIEAVAVLGAAFAAAMIVAKVISVLVLG
jgi:hypothetical protein